MSLRGESRIVRLLTERLVIREFRPSDWRAVHTYATDPETIRYMPWGPNTEADTKIFVRREIGARSFRPRTHYGLAVTLRETGELIGGCTVEKRPRRKEAEVGYILNRAYWGKGYGTEVVRALLAFGFTRLALHRMRGECDPSNIASNRVLVKAGLRLEGHLREDFPMRGKWYDTMVYGILEREWNPSKKVRPT